MKHQTVDRTESGADAELLRLCDAVEANILATPFPVAKGELHTLLSAARESVRLREQVAALTSENDALAANADALRTWWKAEDARLRADVARLRDALSEARDLYPAWSPIARIAGEALAATSPERP